MAAVMSTKASILVADDEPSIRSFLERGLGHAGYNVTAVSDGNAALQALEQGRFDILLTDIVMPDLDGITLALKVASAYPHTKILMMTGYSDQRERAHNLDVLFHDVISKPFGLDDILSIVAKAAAA